jgi:hypothetical protein
MKQFPVRMASTVLAIGHFEERRIGTNDEWGYIFFGRRDIGRLSKR